jgi:hypothetical protein
MSTQQRNDACVVAVDPSLADILRHQTLIVLEANHYYFEDLLSFGPEAQHALSAIYRDAFAVLDAVGWCRPDNPSATVDVPFTAGFVDQLRTRRYDLGHTNIDRLATRDAEDDLDAIRIIDEAISRDRDMARALDRLFAGIGSQHLGGEANGSSYGSLVIATSRAWFEA